MKGRFDTLTNELNYTNKEITTDTQTAMRYLQQHLHGLPTHAGQFSATVNQQVARAMVEKEKIMALEAARKSHCDNLQILVQIIQAEAGLRSKKDTKLSNGQSRKIRKYQICWATQT